MSDQSIDSANSSPDNPRGYDVFTRTWWSSNPAYPNGLEPCLGRKRYIGRRLTYSEAQRMCRQWNAEHNPGRLSRKAEFEAR